MSLDRGIMDSKIKIVKKKYIINYIDEKGYLVQRYEDYMNAIDSNFLNSNSIYQELVYNKECEKPLQEFADRFIKDYQHSLGVIRRYYKSIDGVTDESHNWSNPITVSRDNSMGFIILAGHLGRYDVVRQFAKLAVKRFSFFQNKMTNKFKRKLVPDFCGPSSWATIIRSMFGKKTLVFMFPILLILDFFFMVSLLFDVVKSYVHPKEVSTVFHVISAIVQKKMTIQTPFSFFGSLIYLKFRKPIKEYPHKNNLVSCLLQYSRAKYDPPIYEITEKLLKNFRL